MENPEQRQGGFLDSVYEQRAELLTAALTIWRYGQQNQVRRGLPLPLGNYGVWARWVRDPLLELGCQDPVLRIVHIKADDPRRKAIAEVFEAWWQQHGGQPVKATGLHDEVKLRKPRSGARWSSSQGLRRIDAAERSINPDARTLTGTMTFGSFRAINPQNYNPFCSRNGPKADANSTCRCIGSAKKIGLTSLRVPSLRFRASGHGSLR